MLSVHTSPLDQPGVGDAGGMNVYVLELAKQLAAAGVEIEIFTRATSSHLPPSVQAAPGVTVRHLPAGPYENLPKEELPAQVCSLASGVLRAEAAREPGWYGLVHSHYWLSGQVGQIATERWGVPLVHSMHTMAKVKNQALAIGERPEPRARERGEEHVVRAANRLIANTDDEARQLIELYGADPDRVDTVWPGADLTVFTPGSRRTARQRLGVDQGAVVLLFAGRIQPLKAPDVLVRTVARLLAAEPGLRGRIVVPVVGGPAGPGAERPGETARLARSLGVDDVVRFHPPVDQATLADWYRASDLTVVPSYNESFGLVALESQACGTPVVASAVGGLRTAVRDGSSGVLIEGHNPGDWAHVISALMDDPRRLEHLREGALEHASRFGWDQTAERVLDVYTEASARRRADLLEVCSV
jgi:D-inositol-3-phosphate glycosyltransferase